MSRLLRIAVDGPSGAGKSYLADQIAAALSLIHVDTGALYRAIGLFVQRKGIAPEDSASIIACLSEIDISLRFGNGGQATVLCGEDVSPYLRTPEISHYASVVSAIPEVRTFLLETQRSIAKTTPVILDGRDIGTVILPEADVKLFLVADDDARAERRLRELLEKGIQTTKEEVLADLRSRDARDQSRDTAPAKPAEDAVFLDNSRMTREETVAAALAVIREKIG